MPKRAPKAPSYRGRLPKNDKASLVGRANKKKGTRPELDLSEALSSAGVKHALHSADLPGKPDMIIPRHRIAIFCDGDFWHGRHWRKRRARLSRGTNADYWVAKIASNRSRDARINRALRTLSWRVVRIWESDIRKDPDSAASLIKKRLRRTLK